MIWKWWESERENGIGWGGKKGRKRERENLFSSRTFCLFSLHYSVVVFISVFEPVNILMVIHSFSCEHSCYLYFFFGVSVVSPRILHALSLTRLVSLHPVYIRLCICSLMTYFNCNNLYYILLMKMLRNRFNKSHYNDLDKKRGEISRWWWVLLWRLVKKKSWYKGWYY